jgi:hypothetical protein
VENDVTSTAAKGPDDEISSSKSPETRELERILLEPDKEVLPEVQMGIYGMFRRHWRERRAGIDDKFGRCPPFGHWIRRSLTIINRVHERQLHKSPNSGYQNPGRYAFRYSEDKIPRPWSFGSMGPETCQDMSSSKV